MRVRHRKLKTSEMKKTRGYTSLPIPYGHIIGHVTFYFENITITHMCAHRSINSGRKVNSREIRHRNQ